MFCATRQRSKAEYETTYLVRRMMAVVIVVAILPLIAAEAAGQALFPRDAPKEPGARSWALERMKLPYQPWALAKGAEHRAGLSRGWPGETGQRLYADPQTYCLYAVPRATYRGGFEILQGPGYVLMIFNFGHYSRYIPTDGRPHRAGTRVKLWMGNSRGTWQGNTLVVDVTNLNGRNWLDQVGNFISDNAHVIERFTLANANTIDYEVTIDDPKVFTRPWKIRLPFRRAGGAANDRYVNEIWEACHEGNKAVEDIRELGFRWFPGVVPPN